MGKQKMMDVEVKQAQNCSPTGNKKIELPARPDYHAVRH